MKISWKVSRLLKLKGNEGVEQFKLNFHNRSFFQNTKGHALYSSDLFAM